VNSNFPTPITNQDTPKRRQKAQRLAISPTPPSVSLPISNGPDRFVYVCDCSDEEGGYSAPRVPSLKRKATNSASGSSSRPKEVIEIHTDSDSDSEIRPVPQPRFCKCAALKSFLSSRAVKPDLNHDLTRDSIPEIPRPSPLA
jgi:hypothetical protein